MYQTFLNIINNSITALNRINPKEDYDSKQLSKTYKLFGKYKRIYHYHIRKTAGTSINHMFLDLLNDDSQETYKQLYSSNTLRIIKDDKVFVGWNRSLIERGDYFYAFSHTPMHKIKIPEDTFTITSLRDPSKRVLSHYNMLLDYVNSNKNDHPSLEQEKYGSGITLLIS